MENINNIYSNKVLKIFKSDNVVLDACQILITQEIVKDFVTYSQRCSRKSIRIYNICRECMLESIRCRFIIEIGFLQTSRKKTEFTIILCLISSTTSLLTAVFMILIISVFKHTI